MPRLPHADQIVLRADDPRLHQLADDQQLQLEAEVVQPNVARACTTGTLASLPRITASSAKAFGLRRSDL
jgi:hypothetical protein